MSLARPKSASRKRGNPGHPGFSDQEQRVLEAYGAPPDMLAERAARMAAHERSDVEVAPPPLHAPRGNHGREAAAVAVQLEVPEAQSFEQQAPVEPPQVQDFRRQHAGADTMREPMREASPPQEAQQCRQSSMSPPPSHRATRPGGAPSRRRQPGGANSQKKKDARARNPFIEYDVREKRLIRERKWLQEDSAYLMSRREELRHSKLMKNLNVSAESKEELYEKRTFYGPFSVAMKAQKQRAASAGRQRPQTAPNAEAGPRNQKEDPTPAQLMKKLAQELKTSCSDETQRGFRQHVARMQGLPLEESPRDKDQLQAGMLMAFKGGNFG